MRVGSLWNDLPWLHNDFQVGEAQICFGKLKNSGFSVLHNDSETVEKVHILPFIEIHM